MLPTKYIITKSEVDMAMHYWFMTLSLTGHMI